METIQVSIAHAYPGTEMYDFAKQNGFIVGTERMVDDGGHQVAQIQYPGLPREHVLEMVHKFYDEYYFRPKVAFRLIRKAMFNNSERKRLYKEAREYLALRSKRKVFVNTEKQQSSAVLSSGD